MKATVHICNRAPGKGDLEHNYRGHAKRSKAERSFVGSRVVFVGGDAHGVGVIATEPGNETGTMVVISGPNVGRKGRPLRQAILSAQDLPHATPTEYKAALAMLMAAAPLWIAAFAPGARWIAFGHQDRNHPHVHLVFENWDYAAGKRLDLNPILVEQMQTMDWAKSVGLTSGKGSLGKAKAGKKLDDARMKLTDLNYQGRVQLLAWQSFKGERIAAQALLAWCEETRPVHTVDGIVAALQAGPLPPGWAMRKTKSGNALRHPTIIIEGRHLRIEKFYELWIELLKAPSKGLEITKNGKEQIV